MKTDPVIRKLRRSIVLCAFSAGLNYLVAGWNLWVYMQPDHGFGINVFCFAISLLSFASAMKGIERDCRRLKIHRRTMRELDEAEARLDGNA